jgi:hypothetical protein
MSGAATAIGIGAAVGGIGSIASGAMGASAAKDAAAEQSAAANRAADLQYKASQDALAFQKSQYADSQKNMSPYLDAGKGGLSNLNYLLGNGPQSGTGANTTLGGYGSLMQGYGEFKPPSAQDLLTSDPGYEARLKLGTDAVQRSAAARGNLLTGGTAQALNGFAQDYASNEYGNAYNRALNNYTTNAGNYYTNQNNQYGRLAQLAGMGQQSAANLGALGANTANSVQSNLLGTASQMGQDYQNAGAANASGIVGSANAWGGAIGNATNGLQNMLIMQHLLGNQEG